MQDLKMVRCAYRLMKSLKKSLCSLLICYLSASCVSVKIYEELEDSYNILKGVNAALIEENQDLIQKNKELDHSSKKTQAEKDSVALALKTCTTKFERLDMNHRNIKESYDFLLANNTSMLSHSIKKNKAILDEMEQIRRELDLKEEKLSKQEYRIKSAQQEVKDREARVKELEEVVQKKDSVAKILRQGFQNIMIKEVGNKDSYEVYQKDGKLYLRLKEQLLFSSGSWKVSQLGKKTIHAIAEVLKKEPHINILVEGHTDNVPIKKKSKFIRDNWDLSVLRATSIVRLLIKESKMNPKQITPIGKSFWVPIAPNNTPKNRSKNRRIEFIISPNLEKLNHLIQKVEP